MPERQLGFDTFKLYNKRTLLRNSSERTGKFTLKTPRATWRRFFQVRLFPVREPLPRCRPGRLIRGAEKAERYIMIGLRDLEAYSHLGLDPRCTIPRDRVRHHDDLNQWLDQDRTYRSIHETTGQDDGGTYQGADYGKQRACTRSIYMRVDVVQALAVADRPRTVQRQATIFACHQSPPRCCRVGSCSCAWWVR